MSANDNNLWRDFLNVRRAAAVSPLLGAALLIQLGADEDKEYYIYNEKLNWKLDELKFNRENENTMDGYLAAIELIPEMNRQILSAFKRVATEEKLAKYFMQRDKPSAELKQQFIDLVNLLGLSEKRFRMLVVFS